MNKELFYKKIESKTINGVVVGNWTMTINNQLICVSFIGSLENPLYYVGGDEEEKQLTSFDDVLDHFDVDGKAIREQIDNIQDMECAEYID